MSNNKKITRTIIGDSKYWPIHILWYSKINKANLDTDWVKISRINNSFQLNFFMSKFIDLRSNKDARYLKNNITRTKKRKYRY
jgi:hypothetical protein